MRSALLAAPFVARPDSARPAGRARGWVHTYALRRGHLLGVWYDVSVDAYYAITGYAPSTRGQIQRLCGGFARRCDAGGSFYGRASNLCPAALYALRINSWAWNCWTPAALARPMGGSRHFAARARQRADVPYLPGHGLIARARAMPRPRRGLSAYLAG